MAVSAVADGSSGDTMLRRVAGATLVVGGALALIAAFLPFGRIDWSVIPGEADLTVIPVQPALALLGAPLENIYSLCVAALFLLGLPAGLAALGAATLSRRWTPEWRGFVIAFPMVALEVSYIAFNALFVLLPASPNFPGIARTLEYGAYVMALGNALALVGTILLPRVTSHAAGVSSVS